MLSVLPRTEITVYPDRSLVLGEWMRAPKYQYNASSLGQEAMMPAQIRPQKTFAPTMIFFSGRRGQGKTLAARCVAEMQEIRYKVARIPLATTPQAVLTGDPKKTWKIVSNIWISNAGLYHPKLIDAIAEVDGFDGLMYFPEWGYQDWALIDEIGDVADSMKANSRVNIGVGAMTHQLRKRRMEGCLTSQFPQETSYRLLRQVDLFILVEKHLQGEAIECFVFDYWGQWTGKNWRKPWPPQIGDHDWEVGLCNLKALWTKYNSWEVVPPMWSIRRAELIAREYKYSSERQATSGGASKPILPPPTTFAEALARQMPTLFEVRAALRLAKHMAPQIESQTDLIAWLEENRYTVTKQGHTYYAERPVG